jgi:hypothetical protein
LSPPGAAILKGHDMSLKIKQTDLKRIAAGLVAMVDRMTDDEIIRRAAALMESKHTPDTRKRFVSVKAAHSAGYHAGFMAASRSEPTRKQRTVVKAGKESSEQAKRLEAALKRVFSAWGKFRNGMERDGYHIRARIED